MAIPSSLHVMRQPLGHIVRIAADNKPCFTQLLKGRAGSRHLSTTGALTIVKRAVRLNSWHRRWHLHRATEGSQTPHVHHRLPALGDGLIVRLCDVDITRTNAVLWASFPAKALSGNFLIVLEGILEDGGRIPHSGNGDTPCGGELDSLRRPRRHPDR